jgi:polyhydroxyalkanoate synthesis regulator phasin
MTDPDELEDLVAYLVRSSRLSRAEATRLVDEVITFLDESAEDFICRRHRELQRDGFSNSEIFSRIGVETARRRFRAPTFTERQIRRIVYG